MTKYKREIGYEDDGERKVRKVMGKLHDEIRRVLREQGTAIQTHVARGNAYNLH